MQVLEKNVERIIVSMGPSFFGRMINIVRNGVAGCRDLGIQLDALPYYTHTHTHTHTQRSSIDSAVFTFGRCAPFDSGQIRRSIQFNSFLGRKFLKENRLTQFHLFRQMDLIWRQFKLNDLT